MYGMVNEGIRALVLENHGADTWAMICEKARIPDTEFERMTSYDDAVTHRLVGAICEHTDLEAGDVLEVFGRYWIKFAGSSSYGNLMRLAGDTFVERLENLDDMHERIQCSMPHLRPPSFEITQIGERQYLLDYFSSREGLACMVTGLLHGLAAETGEKVAIKQIRHKAETKDHDSFEIILLE